MNPVFSLAQLAVNGYERADRARAYEAARATADRLGKPLLNVGCASTRLPPSHPCGDVCIDLDPRRLLNCRADQKTVADVRHIPYPSGYFGAALVAHVLEHLPTVADAERALAELRRVADYVFVASPSRLGLLGWFVPDHHLWVNHGADGSLTFEQRHWNESFRAQLKRLWDAKDSAEIAATTVPGTGLPRRAG